MPFTPFGLGRDPKFIRTVRKYDINYSEVIGSATPFAETAIEGDQQLATYMLVSIYVVNTSAGTDQLITFRIDSDEVARYTVPVGQVGQAIWEMVPLNKELVNPKLFRLDTSRGGGAGTQVIIKATLYTVTI